MNAEAAGEVEGKGRVEGREEARREAGLMGCCALKACGRGIVS